MIPKRVYKARSILRKQPIQRGSTRKQARQRWRCTLLPETGVGGDKSDAIAYYKRLLGLPPGEKLPKNYRDALEAY